MTEVDWGKQLSKFIAASEARVASYKKLVQQAYKAGDRELVDLFKSFQKDEEKYLKRRRLEKRYWNEDVWGWYFMESRKLYAEDEANPDTG